MKSNIAEHTSRVESDAGKLIILFLHQVGNATVDHLQDSLNITYGKACSVLDALEEKGLVVQLEASASQRYQLAHIEW